MTLASLAYQAKRRAQALETIQRWAGEAGLLVGSPFLVGSALRVSFEELADHAGGLPVRAAALAEGTAQIHPEGRLQWPEAMRLYAWEPATVYRLQAGDSLRFSLTKPARVLVFPFITRPEPASEP
ncbi:hypothetical protein [Rubrivivax gelatinosus]|uniref:hypothetical protein n=1 Tax=Rubrivivax gelatinosus TaxID=28068 RepID=UPI0005C140B8|nr:hypothetical protein [Rubrivivax gelatinosus]MBG6078702.1 hypothetical protein [Rubrivivax gelatinosus]